MQLQKDYHVEVNEHAALMVCRAFLFVLLAHFMHGKSCIGNGKLPVFPSSSVLGQLNWNFLRGFHKHFCRLNYVVFFAITPKSESVKAVDGTGSDSCTC